MLSMEHHTDWVNDIALCCGGRTCKKFHNNNVFHSRICLNVHFVSLVQYLQMNCVRLEISCLRCNGACKMSHLLLYWNV